MKSVMDLNVTKKEVFTLAGWQSLNMCHPQGLSRVGLAWSEHLLVRWHVSFLLHKGSG